MEPRIQDGDLLLVDTTEQQFHSFGVYVLEVGGERLVKRVQRKVDGSLTLISDNTAYEADHVPAAEAANVTSGRPRAVVVRPGVTARVVNARSGRGRG